MESEEDVETEHWTLLFLSCFIIGTSALFELAEEWLQKKFQSEVLNRKVINAVFKELTILGFVGLVMMALVKSGAMDFLDRALFNDSHERSDRRLFEEVNAGADQALTSVETVSALLQSASTLPSSMKAALMDAAVAWEQSQDKGVVDKEEEEVVSQLAMLFEEVHIMIFKVMLCFIALVVILLTQAVATRNDFMEAERVKSKDHLDKFYNGNLSYFGRMRVIQKIQYRILRREFFHPSIGTIHTQVRPANFSFATYLGMCMAEWVCQLIEVPASTWLFLMGLVFLVKPFMDLRDRALMFCLNMVSWILFGSLCLQTWQMFHVYQQCLPEICPSMKDPNPTKGDKNLKSTTPRFFNTEMVRARFRFTKWICGTSSPNKHEMCFFMWTNGPAFNNFCIRLQIFIQAVFLAIYFQILFMFPWLFWHHWRNVVMQWIPFISGLVFVWPLLIFYATIATSTGLMKKDEVILRTVSVHTHKAYEQYHSLIYELNTHACIHDVKQKTDAEYEAWMKEFLNSFEKNLSSEERHEIYEAFKKWDTDESGTINEDEFVNALCSMGRTYSEAKRIAQIWFRNEVFRGTSVEFTGVQQKSFSSYELLHGTETIQTDANGSLQISSPLETKSSPRVLHSPRIKQRPAYGMESLGMDSWLPEAFAFTPAASTSYGPLLTPTKMDSLNVQEFTVLHIQIRELEAHICADDTLLNWMKSISENHGGSVSVEEFLAVEPMKTASTSCGIQTEEQVRQLFFSIANPEGEDEVILEIKFEELVAWIGRLMDSNTGSGYYRTRTASRTF